MSMYEIPVMSGAKRFLKKGRIGRSKSHIAWLTALLFLVVGLLPGTAFAHPPKSVTLAYDAATKVLKVTILHPSFMPSWHYIKTVTVEKNKQSAGNYVYKNQPGDEFAYTYEIPAQPGETLVVNVYCSMYGSRTESLTIAAPAAPTAPKP
jgi:hypothetical protein